MSSSTGHYFHEYCYVDGIGGIIEYLDVGIQQLHEAVLLAPGDVLEL